MVRKSTESHQGEVLGEHVLVEEQVGQVEGQEEEEAGQDADHADHGQEDAVGGLRPACGHATTDPASHCSLLIDWDCCLHRQCSDRKINTLSALAPEAM